MPKPMVLVQGSLRAVCVESTYAPALSITISFPTASAATAPGVASLACKLLMEGTHSLPGNAFAQQLELLGAFVGLTAGTDHTELGISCRAAVGPAVMDLLAQVFTEPQLSEDHFLRIRKELYQQLQVSEQKNSPWASYYLRQSFYPEHLYGRTTLSIDVEKIEYQQVLDWIKTVLLTSAPTVYIAGAQAETVAAYVFKALGFWTGTVHHKPALVELAPANLGAAIHKEGPSKLQTTVMAGTTTLPMVHEQYVAYRLGTVVYGGYFGSRLMSNIREEKGYTYGIGCQIKRMVSGQYLAINTEVKAEAAEDTLVQIKLELDKLHQELIPELELEIVKNYVLGSYLGSINTATDVLSRIKANDALGLLDFDHEHYYNAMMDTSAEEIQTALQQHLRVEALTTVTVGP